MSGPLFKGLVLNVTKLNIASLITVVSLSLGDIAAIIACYEFIVRIAKKRLKNEQLRVSSKLSK